MPQRDWNEYVRRHLPHLGLRPEREVDVISELAAEFEQAYQDALGAGQSEAEAAALAETHVRDWNRLASELRAANQPPSPQPPREAAGPGWSGLLHDIRYALRTLRLNPVFAAIAILTLAFGIGGNTAIFTVVDHIVLRGLPYPDAGRLMNIEHTKVDQPEIDPWCAIDNLLDFRRRSQSFESISGISPVWNVVLAGDGVTERLESLYVSSTFFPMLGVRPALGRLFAEDEDQRAQPSPVAILSHAFWMRRFGGSTSVIGKGIRLDGSIATVVGVLPEDFRWLGEPLTGTATNIDIWMPLASNQLARSPRTLRFLKVTGKLKPGISPQQAQDEVRRIGAKLTSEFAEANGNLNFAGVLLETRITGRLRPAVYLLLVTIGFVLLMASANVANLLLTRVTMRNREIAVRIALGASWSRLLRQLVVESTVLAAFGGLLGLGLAQALVRLILAYGPPSALQASRIGLDWRALLFTSSIVITTALLAGLLPAWRALTGNAAGAVVREGRGTGRNNRKVRALLAATQVTIALVLLIGSGLLIRSFLRVLAIDPGFDAHNVLSISTQLPPGYSNPEQRAVLHQELLDRLRGTAGVVNAGEVSRLPMLGQNLASLLEIEGVDTGGHPPEVEFRAATPGYFPTLGVPLLAGRLFDDRDSNQLRVLLIDELTAKRYFAGADPVGKRVRFLADRNAPWFTVIGVVGSIRHFGLEADPRPTIYRPAEINPLFAPVLVIRTASDPAALTQQLSQVVRSIHADMPVYNVYLMEQLVARSTAERRFLMWLITAFSIGALLLAGIGVYGAISQSVVQRTQEIGVRMALGAAPSQVMGLVFGEYLQIGAPAIVAGLALAWIGARLGQKLLFQVQPHDALVFGGAVLSILLLGAIACYAPALRATRVDPLISLRDS